MVLQRFIVILVSFVLTYGCASSEEFIRPGAEIGKYKRIAVLPLSDYPNAHGSGVIVADLISMSLMTSNLFIIDRSQTSAILSEQGLGMSGLVDENTAPEAGRILGVQALLTGSVSEWSTETSNIQMVQGAQPAYLSTSAAGLTLKLIDCETGQILWAGSARGSEIGLMVQSIAAKKAVKHLTKKLLSHY